MWATGSTSSSSAVRLEDCPPRLAQALRGLDMGNHTIDCLDVEEAFRARDRLRCHRWSLVAMLTVCVSLLLIEHVSVAMAPFPHASLRERRVLQDCSSEPTPAEEQSATPGTSTSDDATATDTVTAEATTNGAAASEDSSNATSLEPSNATAPDDGAAAQEAPEAGADGGMGLDMPLPEVFAYVWVVGGSLFVCCAVILFIHRSNAVMALPCFKCLRG